MKFPITAALTAILTLTATTTFAADTPPPMDGKGDHMNHFKESDTNSDGFISKDEWRAKGDKMFAEIDTNHDGKISDDEMKAHHGKRHAEWMARHHDQKPEHDGAPADAPKPASH